MYATLDDILTATSNAELLALDTDQQAALRDAAIVAIEDFCSQSFTAEDATIVVDGNDANRIWLPRRLASLTSAEVLGTALGASDLVIGDNGASLTVKPISEGNYYERALLDLDPQPRVFRRGTRGRDDDATVTLTGTWGWLDEETPAAVATAMRVDMEDNASADAHALSSTVHAMRQLGIRQIQQGRMATALDPVSPFGLSLRAQRALGRRLRWTPGGVAV